MTLRSATKSLLGLAVGLPIVQAVLFWVGGLLANMGDEGGARIIRHVVTACQVVWAISVVGLVITLALVVLSESSRENNDIAEEPEEE
jgi:hypothetical protein